MARDVLDTFAAHARLVREIIDSAVGGDSDRFYLALFTVSSRLTTHCWS